VNDLIGVNLMEVFDFLFLDCEDSVIIWGDDNGILRMNHAASEFFSQNNMDELHRKMDKSSIQTWHDFLKDATISNLATCHISLSDPLTGKRVYHVEGYYHQSTIQYIIRFKQVDEASSKSPGEAEKGLMKYDSFFQYAPQGLILTTRDGIIVDVNQQIGTFFGFPSEELTGKSLQGFLDLLTEFKMSSTHFGESLLTKGQSDKIISVKDAKGESKYFQFETNYDHQIDMYLTVFRDETEKVQLKKQIEHTSSLSTLGQLAASIAHEIRNPMTSLKGFTQLLSHQVTTEGLHYLEIINSELERMESILNEFLMLSKPVERSFHLISVSSIVSQVIDFMNPQAINQNIELEFVSCEQESDSILGNDYELKKVFMNILKNAIEVMPEGGKIMISQSFTERNQVRISVQDQGGGMNQDQMHKIFLPFYTSKKDGTGLGLAHAIQTIEDHGGCIEVESRVNEGTTFHLNFPLYHVDAVKEKTVYDQSYTKSYWEVISSN